MNPAGRALQRELERRCRHPLEGVHAFARSALDEGVVRSFERQAELHADRPAVESESARLTYAQLNALANTIAHALLGVDADKGSNAGPVLGAEPYVAVLTERGVMNIAAPLGVLKAGKAFLPLDTHWPEARMQWVLEHSRTRIILSCRSNLARARRICGPHRQVLVLEDLRTASNRANPELPIDSGAPAYVLYTSGSTGRPKGVSHSHRSLCHEVLRLTDVLHVCAHDRQSLLRADSAGAISDLFTALLNGAALCPIDVLVSGTERLARWVERERITIWRSTPSLFRAVLSGLAPDAVLPDLRIVFLCGEPVFASDLLVCREHCTPGCLFVNCLGSTECATVTLHFCAIDAPAPAGPVPVGYPVRDMDLLLVDESGAAVAPGVVGEIVVRSRYLADGYVDEPALTAMSFRADPHDTSARLYFSGDMARRLDDGSLVYEGRKDARVNLNGRTFELAEVEMALQAMPGIGEAVAAVVTSTLTSSDKTDVTDKWDDTQLVAYFVSDAASTPTVGALRAWLAQRLAPHMIPARFVAVDRIPLTTTGKADRRLLAESHLPRSDSRLEAVERTGANAADAGRKLRAQTPPPDAERRLSQWWSELIGVSAPGRDDNFFEAGGNSLTALRLFNRIRQAYGVDVTLATFVESPTIAGLCRKICGD